MNTFFLSEACFIAWDKRKIGGGGWSRKVLVKPRRTEEVISRNCSQYEERER